ncbi:MAG: S8 family peptidase, partial [Bacteroidales bacterium]|nr:S8 family peptidase [Bacteroidales bacterium]
AIENGAKVISCSWGSDTYSITNETVMKACYEKGIIVIAAAGNDNISTPHYPAAYTPYVISVGSVDADKRKSSFSNYGYWIDILSPGGEDTASYKTLIFSTTFCQNQYSRLYGKTDEFTGKYYDEMSGTSMATPVLAGIVALMVSHDSTLTTDQVRTILQNTGQNIAGSDTLRFNKYCQIADAYGALNLLKKEPTFGPRIPTNDITAISSHDSVLLEWKALETTEAIKGYRIYRNGALIADDHKTLSFLDTDNRTAGTIRYAVEPLFENENILSIKTEIDVTIKNYYTVTAIVRPDTACGSVEGIGEYELRQLFTLKAVPAKGYSFDYWTDESGMPLHGTTISGPTLKNRRFFAYFKKEVHNEALENLNNALTVTPNPASEEVTVQCPEFELSHIRVIDLQGKTVYDAACKTHTQTIAVGTWPKGTYMVQVTTSAGTIGRKLIKR